MKKMGYVEPASYFPKSSSIGKKTKTNNTGKKNSGKKK